MDSSLDTLIVRYNHIREELIGLIESDTEANNQAVVVLDGQLIETYDKIMSLNILPPIQRQTRIRFLTTRITELREESETVTQITDKILADVSELVNTGNPDTGVHKQNVIPFKDRNSESARYNSIRNELTKQKAAQIKSNYLEQAIKSISDGFILYDADSNLIFYNDIHLSFFPHLAQLYLSGAKREEIWRHHAIKMHENDPEIDVEAYVKMRKSQGSEPRPDYERQLIDGRWVATRERILADGGVVSIRTDITEQKLAMDKNLKIAT